MLQAKYLLVISTLFIMLSGCKKDDDLFKIQPDDTVDQNVNKGIDPAFSSFVKRFVDEGRKRGFNIELASRNITIQFTDINQQQSPNVVGMCSYDGRFRNDITIDIAFWERANDLQKEFILFHELGHCYLRRGHRNDVIQNGFCASIMRGGNPGCADAYTPANRNYYINELFSSSNSLLN